MTLIYCHGRPTPLSWEEDPHIAAESLDLCLVFLFLVCFACVTLMSWLPRGFFLFRSIDLDDSPFLFLVVLIG